MIVSGVKVEDVIGRWITGQGPGREEPEDNIESLK